MTIEQKKLRERANRLLNALKKEKKTHGDYDDGGGKRYRIGVYLVLAGDIEKAAEYYDWYEQEFPDDVGEPAALLLGAIAAHRNKQSTKARIRLALAMLSNLWLLPFVAGRTLDAQDIWFSSNRSSPDYIDEIHGFLETISTEERRWIGECLDLPQFIALRDGHLTAFAALKHERDVTRRRAILERWDEECAEVMRAICPQ